MHTKKNARCAARAFISRQNRMVCERGDRDHHFFSAHRVEFNLSGHYFSQFAIHNSDKYESCYSKESAAPWFTCTRIVCDPHTASHHFIYSFIQSYLVLFHSLIFSSFIRLRVSVSVCLHLIYVIDLQIGFIAIRSHDTKRPTMVLVVSLMLNDFKTFLRRDFNLLSVMLK